MQRLADHESKSGREEVELAKIGGTVRGWGGGGYTYSCVLDVWLLKARSGMHCYVVGECITTSISCSGYLFSAPCKGGGGGGL